MGAYKQRLCAFHQCRKKNTQGRLEKSLGHRCACSLHKFMFCCLVHVSSGLFPCLTVFFPCGCICLRPLRLHEEHVPSGLEGLTSHCVIVSLCHRTFRMEAILSRTWLKIKKNKSFSERTQKGKADVGFFFFPVPIVSETFLNEWN